MTRTLYGIGAGPGDPELMTVRGLRLLELADCVFMPATRPGFSFARSIVDSYLRPERQRVVELVCPAFRQRSAIIDRWVELARLVTEVLTDDQIGAFVCEGDPSLYSTWSHLCNGLRQTGSSIITKTIPGVSSVSAAAAAAGVALATWNERLMVAPAPSDKEALNRLLQEAETVVLLKAGSELAGIVQAIDAQSPAVVATLVRRVGRPDEQVLRSVLEMKDLEQDYFTTILLQRTDA